MSESPHGSRRPLRGLLTMRPHPEERPEGSCLEGWKVVLTFCLTFVLAMAGAMPSSAADSNPTERLGEIERALEKSRRDEAEIRRRAQELEGEAWRVQRDLVTAAQVIQDLEAEALGLEGELTQLTAAEAEKREQVARNRNRAGRVLLALERLARHPPEAVLVSPLPPDDLVRSAVVLRTAVPVIEMESRALGAELDRLAKTRAEIASKKRALTQAVTALEVQKRRLDSLMGTKREAVRVALAESKDVEGRMGRLAREAEDLKALLDRIEDDRRAREAKAVVPAPAPPEPVAGLGRPLAEPKGQLLYPAIGRLVGSYGQPTESGMTRRGLVIETRPGAAVVAPHGGSVVFAGLFRAYGLLLIIEHGEGYHSLLAGLWRIDAEVGQKLLGGEPIGAMGDDASGKTALYVELRLKGQPVNPVPWLAARKGKVSG